MLVLRSIGAHGQSVPRQEATTSFRPATMATISKATTVIPIVAAATDKAPTVNGREKCKHALTPKTECPVTPKAATTAESGKVCKEINKGGAVSSWKAGKAARKTDGERTAPKTAARNNNNNSKSKNKRSSSNLTYKEVGQMLPPRASSLKRCREDEEEIVKIQEHFRQSRADSYLDKNMSLSLPVSSR